MHSMPDMGNILVTGAVGQIGSELTLALRDCHGADRVVVAEEAAARELGHQVMMAYTTGETESHTPPIEEA